MAAYRPRGTSVYVGGLSERVRKENLSVIFEKYGKLNNVWIAYNPPGFAFIEFAHTEDAECACENLNATEIMGSKVKVNISRGRGRGRAGGRVGGFRGYKTGREFFPRGGTRGGFRGSQGLRGSIGGSRGRYGDVYEFRRGGYCGRQDYGRSLDRNRRNESDYYGGRDGSSSRCRSRSPVGRGSYFSSRDYGSLEGAFAYGQSGDVTKGAMRRNTRISRDYSPISVIT